VFQLLPDREIFWHNHNYTNPPTSVATIISHQEKKLKKKKTSMGSLRNKGKKANGEKWRL